MSAENGQLKYVGKPRPIIDGEEKVTGQAKYTADVKLPYMLYMRPVFSPYAHALISSIDKSTAEAMPGVVAVLTAADLPTAHKTINSRNTAVLAKERVQWAGQPVAVVVAESEAQAADAAEQLFIEYEPLPAVIRLEEAIQHGSTEVWPNGMPKDGDDLSSIHAQVEAGQKTIDTNKPNNMSGEVHFKRGDVAAGLAEADVVIERTYKTSMVHQGYLEPHAVVVDPQANGRGVTIYTSTQGQFSVRDEIAKLFDLPLANVLVQPMTVGGGFGAKYGIYEPLVVAAALVVKKPVRLNLSRSEDFLSSTPAPQTIIQLKTGAKKDGTMTAIQATMYVDNGVFNFGHGGIMSMLIGGYYKWPHLQLDAYEINTHKAPVGAYRAPGAPQATFAIESHVDDMAQQLGLDPLEFRLQNAVEAGDLMGVGRPWPKQIGLKLALERLKAHPLWQNRQPGDGTGIAIGGWPTVMGTAEATCRVDTDGTVRVNLGIVDISGAKSSFVLVAAEALGVSPDKIIMVQDGTDGAYGPNSGGSQVTYTVSGAVRQAAEAAKKQLIAIAAEEFEAAEEDIVIEDGEAMVRGVPGRKKTIGELAGRARNKRGGPGPILGEGKSAPPEAGPSFVAHLAKIEVDPETGVIKPTHYVAIQDVGFALNPLLVEGQIQGGAVQAIGMTLYESMVHSEDGQLLTASFMDYGLPRSDNTPVVEAIALENPSPHGPFGARGIAESPLTPGPAALANALKDKLGIRLLELPLRPELVWQALQK